MIIRASDFDAAGKNLYVPSEGATNSSEKGIPHPRFYTVSHQGL